MMQTLDRIPSFRFSGKGSHSPLARDGRHSSTALSKRKLTNKISILPAFVAAAALGFCLALTGCSGVSAKSATPDSIASSDGLSASPASIDFGAVNLGNSNNSKLTLSNSSTASVVVSQISASDPSFTVDGQNQLPLTIAGGASTTVMVHFKPQGQGDVYADLTIASGSQTGASSSAQPRGFSTVTSTTSMKVRLHGKGSPTPSSGTTALSGLTCSSGTLTGVASDTCTVTLNAIAPSSGYTVSLASNNIAAVSVPTSVTVPANATSVHFTASASTVSAPQTATLTASDANGVSMTYTIQLNPPTASVATLSINATSINFGNVSLSSPSTQSVTLSSTGTAAVTVNSATVTGTGYTLQGATLPATLNPGQSTTLNVQFDPTSAGTDTGQLTITSNSSTNSTASVALSGTGVVPHVSLTWSAPTGSDPIAGYKVYRAPSGSSSYTQLNSQISANQSYTDTNVQVGTTYQYYVTSVDSSGAESTPSNTASIAVP